MAEYARTWAELADKSGESQSTLTRYKRLDGFPKKTRRGWNADRVGKFVARVRREKVKTVGPGESALTGLKAERLQIGIEIARLEHRKMLGELIPRDEHEDAFREYAGIVNQAFDQWVSQVASLTKDAKLVRGAKLLRDRARRFLVQKLGD